MNKTDISKEKIIAVSIGLLRENPLGELNMRQVAKGCGVSVGSVYNYFPSKADLSIALIETVWGRMFHNQEMGAGGEIGYPSYVAQLYKEVHTAQKEYHNFFLRHRNLFVGGEKQQGREAMGTYMRHMEVGLLQVLAQDTKVKKNLWTESFTKEALVKFTIETMISALSRGAEDCVYFKALLESSMYDQ